MLALTGPRVQAVVRTYGRNMGLDDRSFTRARAIIERVLENRGPLTREELGQALARGRIEATGQRLAALVMDAELEGAICSGPRRGRLFTYALLNDRVPQRRRLARDEALAELALRYFRSHGPATVRDFAWWSGLTMTDARRATDAAGADVLPAAPGPDRVRGAHFLLPNYDEYPCGLQGPRGRHRSLVRAQPGRVPGVGVSPLRDPRRARGRKLAAARDGDVADGGTGAARSRDHVPAAGTARAGGVLRTVPGNAG